MRDTFSTPVRISTVGRFMLDDIYGTPGVTTYWVVVGENLKDHSAFGLPRGQTVLCTLVGSEPSATILHRVCQNDNTCFVGSTGSLELFLHVARCVPLPNTVVPRRVVSVYPFVLWALAGLEIAQIQRGNTVLVGGGVAGRVAKFVCEKMDCKAVVSGAISKEGDTEKNEENEKGFEENEKGFEENEKETIETPSCVLLYDTNDLRAWNERFVGLKGLQCGGSVITNVAVGLDPFVCLEKGVRVVYHRVQKFDRDYSSPGAHLHMAQQSATLCMEIDHWDSDCVRVWGES